MIEIDELVSRIDEAPISSREQHPHRELIKKALRGPEWHQSESGDRYLAYQVADEKRERIWHMQAVYVPTIRQISSNLYRGIKSQGVRDIDSLIQICNELLERRTHEYRGIAFDWCYRMKRHYDPRHYSTFEHWATNHLTNWGSVDDFCTHTMGYFLYKYPQFAPKIKKWAKAENPWIRRAAAVSFIYGLRRGPFLDHIFEVADALLTDQHKYVQWGYGWMLKEATKYYQDQVFEYIMRNKAFMPRPALRYAIEKMPQELKAKAMKK